MSAAPEFGTQLLCVKCGQEGHATWARNSLQKYGSRTAPTGTFDGFYLRIGKKFGVNPQLVCAKCGTVQRDWVV